MQRGIVGGILAIVGSAIGGLLWLGYFGTPLLLFLLIAFAPLSVGDSEMWWDIALYAGGALLALLLAAIGIAGGICSVRRRAWGWALAGAIAGTLLFPPTGVIAVGYVAQARQEFARPPAALQAR